MQAESGTCAVTGYPGMPAKARSARRRYLDRAVLGAVDHGPAAGAPGATVDGAPAVAVSLFDTMTDIMGYQLTFTQHSGIDQQPLGMEFTGRRALRAFGTRDSQTVVLGTTNDREWQRVAREIIERPDLADDPRYATNPDRCEHRDELNAAIETWCAAHDLVDIQKIADAAGIGNSRYNVPSEVVAHPAPAGPGTGGGRCRHGGRDRPRLPPPVISGRIRATDGRGARTRRAHRRRPRRTRA